MLELFSRTLDTLAFEGSGHLIPIPMGEEGYTVQSCFIENRARFKADNGVPNVCRYINAKDGFPRTEENRLDNLTLLIENKSPPPRYRLDWLLDFSNKFIR